jgi:hypothetical protein
LTLQLTRADDRPVDRLTLGIDPTVGQERADIAARRLAELESGRAKPVPGAEVMARARKIGGF